MQEYFLKKNICFLSYFYSYIFFYGVFGIFFPFSLKNIWFRNLIFLFNLSLVLVV